MFVYSVKGKHAIQTAFFAELEINILITEKSYKILHHQHLFSKGYKKREYTCSPIELITNVALFLNAAGMITKIVGLNENYNKKQSETYKNRIENLHKTMEIDTKLTKELSSLDLRNSMEHMDDRIDSIYQKTPDELVIWDLTEQELHEGHTLRKFNPNQFTISCINRELEIQNLNAKKCYKNIQYIKAGIAKAREK